MALLTSIYVTHSFKRSTALALRYVGMPVRKEVSLPLPVSLTLIVENPSLTMQSFFSIEKARAFALAFLNLQFLQDFYAAAPSAPNTTPSTVVFFSIFPCPSK